eukprot:gene2221-17826_t
MANTCSHYIPNYATLTQPLRELTKKNNTFKWTIVEQRAFNQLKKKLTQAPTLTQRNTVCLSSIRGQLHELPRKRVLNKHKKAKENIEKKKAQNKEYYGKKHNTKESEIKVGDTVICLQKRTNKLVPKFSPERFIVQERKGTKILVKNRRHIITRNVSHFKRVPATDSYNNEEEDISDSDSKKEKKEQEKIEVDDRPRRSKRSKIPVWRFGFMQM